MTSEPTTSRPAAESVATTIAAPPAAAELATEIAPLPAVEMATEIAPLPLTVEMKTEIAPLPTNPDEIPANTLIINTYQVKRLLGGGGMGEVYLARHARLGTEHAIKVVRPSMGDNTQVMDLFYREARVLRGVRHDAVVNYDGFVQDAEGRDYLVMEYVEGVPLSDRLKRQPLTATEVLSLRDRLCAGLATAHRQGAVHRDLSPDNVILPGGEIAAAKLIDFGLCKLTDPEQKTIVGAAFAGKYRYAAPEQFGMFGGVVDGRTDIYSLGLVLVAAATGRPLEMGNEFMDALRYRQQVPDLSAIAPELQEWLTAMLQPNPADRPATIDELLERWPAKTLLVPRASAPAPAPEDATAMGAWRDPLPSPPQPQNRRWLFIGGGLMTVAAASAGLWWVLQPLPLVTLPTSAPPVTAALPERQPALPVVSDELDQLIQSNQLDAALALLQTRQTAGTPASSEQTWALAQRLRAAGKLDATFPLLRGLATSGHGAACFALAEFYDPQHWSAATSPFSKPNAEKARNWYQCAVSGGVTGAAERLAALPTEAGR
ncbi:hypothetical protein CKO12_10925 [Chromatium okenii]|uniref:serine/threonine-protein kinase n=1 Tax=Chromatium okenii TaxID=61644 RepID=UPI001905885E|nr:serine/threonine-protein kinase [Chromatium okenii]MBK1642381.1 hypothetical protein [Chromatium okenii]